MSDLEIALAVGRVMNPIGLTFSLMIVLIYIILAGFDLKHVNRMTLRLIAAITIADIIIHLGVYFSIRLKNSVSNLYCQGFAAFHIFGKLLYCFTNLAISYHLYRAIVQLKKSTWKFELIVWFAMMFTMGPIMMGFYFLGVYSRERQDGCIPGSDVPLYSRVFQGFMGFLMLLTTIISVYVTYVGHKSLTHWINTYANHQINREDDQRKFKQNRRRMAERSFLYPLSTLLTLPAEAVYNVLASAGLQIDRILIFTAFSTGLCGILTAVAFSIDPALWKSVRIARLQLLNWYYGRNCINESTGMNPSQGGLSESQTNLNLNNI